MSKFQLHGRNRRECCPVYSLRYDPVNDRATPKVFRPFSERQVSAVNELNRLSDRIEVLEVDLKAALTREANLQKQLEEYQ